MTERTAGITKCEGVKKFDRYLEWLKRGNINYIILDHDKNNTTEDLKKCSFLILTGGVDMHQDFTGLEPDNELHIKKRDEFELKLLDHALKNNIPVLGICRGMQVINVKLNGTLVSDIEKKYGLNHKKYNETKDRYHEVELQEGSLIQNITGLTSGTVNSSHHQCIDKPGDGIIITGLSDEKIPESIEWKNRSESSILLGIQWHPERLEDIQNPFSLNILNWINKVLKQ